MVKFRWDAKHEKETVSSYVKTLKKLPFTEMQINSLSRCAKDKFKSTYPNGINLPKDQYISQNDSLLTACISEANLVIIPPLNNELAIVLIKQIQEKLPNSISTATKQKLGACLVASFKEKYPKGFVFNESERNLYQERIYALSSDCAEKMIVNNVLAWNLETEALYKYGLTKEYTSNGTSAYADCFVKELKIKYPSGYTINEFNKAELTKAFDEIKKLCQLP